MAGGWPRRHPRDKACAWQAPGGLPGLGRHRGTDRSPGVVGHLQAPWWLSLRSAVSRVTVSLLGAWFPLCPRGPSGPGVAGACAEGSPLLGQQWTRRGGSETAGPSTEPVSSTRLQCWGFAVTGALWGTAVGTVQAPRRRAAAPPALQDMLLGDKVQHGRWQSPRSPAPPICSHVAFTAPEYRGRGRCWGLGEARMVGPGSPLPMSPVGAGAESCEQSPKADWPATAPQTPRAQRASLHLY